MIKDNLLSKYYLATPLFVLAEFVTDANIRISIPWGTNYFLYMGICFAIGGLFLKKPLHINLFSLTESSFNFYLLMKSVYLPVFMMAGRLEQAGAANFEMADIIHFILVGVVLLYAFYTNPIFKKR